MGLKSTVYNRLFTWLRCVFRTESTESLSVPPIETENEEEKKNRQRIKVVVDIKLP